MKTGLYSAPPAPGTHLLYWVDIATRFGDGNSGNPHNFDKEPFIASCVNALEQFAAKGGEIFIEIPKNQTYEPFSTHVQAWLEEIVAATKDHPACAGYYIADEPEIHGSDSRDADGNLVNTDPPISYAWLLDRYRRCKAVAPDKPVLCVFADLKLFREKYGHLVKIDPCFDIFGFDMYPFNNSPNHREKWEWFGQWRDIVTALPGSPVPIMYVGQGCGLKNPRGGDNFGQQDMTPARFDEQYARALRAFGPRLEYYLLWDWHYADPAHRFDAAAHLGRIANGLIPAWPEPNAPARVPLIRRVLNWISGLFRRGK